MSGGNRPLGGPRRGELSLDIASTWDGEPARPGEVAKVSLRGSAEGLRVSVEAPFHGDRAPQAPPGSTEGLWDFEVVELFVAGPGQRYLELELGPFGHWLALELEGVRRRAGPPQPLLYQAKVEGKMWRGEAIVEGRLIPPGPHRINAYALHGEAPRRYLALSPVFGQTPDFHQLERFVPATLP